MQERERALAERALDALRDLMDSDHDDLDPAELYRLGYDSGYHDAEKRYMVDGDGWSVAAEAVRLPGESPCKFAFGGEGWAACEVHGWSGPREQRHRVTVCPDVNG